MNFIKSDDGFSLVELAISVTIVGVLIAAVLKGGEMIDNARSASLISQVRSLEASVTSFQSAYGSYPGDLPDVTLLDCAAGCVGGDGNNRIVMGQTATDAGTTNPGWSTKASRNNDEPVQFWKQLAVAELVSSVISSASTTDLSYGASHPESSFGGGFDVYYDTSLMVNGLRLGQRGHYFRLSAGGISNDNQATMSLIKPLIAYTVDQKIDDGLPYTGRVVGAGSPCASNQSPTFTTPYSVALDDAGCTMFFKFGGRRG